MISQAWLFGFILSVYRTSSFTVIATASKSTDWRLKKVSHINLYFQSLLNSTHTLIKKQRRSQNVNRHTMTQPLPPFSIT